MTVSPADQTFVFSASGEKFFADGIEAEPVFQIVTTASEWDAEVQSSWCSIEKDIENMTLTLHAEACTSDENTPETAVITITAGNAVPVEITVNQELLTADIYVAGYVYYDPQIRTAVYWKNGEVMELVDRETDSYVRQIYVSDDAVYVLGGIDDPENGWLTGYWKNGEFTAFPKTRKPEAYEFQVTENGDVYAVGYDKLKAVYWKNDEEVKMETVTSYAYGMCLDGEDLHIVGTRYVKGTGMVGAYWKNGELVSELQNGSYCSVCVNDGKVYLLGTESAGSEEDGTSTTVPFYTVDGEKHILSEEGINDGVMNKIRVLDGKVICTGTGYHYEERMPDNVDIEYHFAQCWIDGEAMPLTENEGEACGIAAFAGNIYIAGVDFNDIEVVNRAVYWKNGERIALDDTVEAKARDIFIKVRE